MSLFVVASQACSVPTAELPRSGTCEPFRLTGVSPALDEEGVPVGVTLAATFNDFPEPETVNPSTVLLYTGFFYHTGRFWVDLVERRALFKPTGDLRPGLGYTFVIKPAIRSLRGCLLESPPPDGHGSAGPTTYAFQFQTAASGTQFAPTPVPPPPATFQDVTTVFGAHCAGSGCHLAAAAVSPDPATTAEISLLSSTAISAARCLPNPGGGLSLCERDAHDALVGVPSRQVNPLVLVATGDSSRSYLLRKIVGAPPLVGHSGVPNDSLSDDDKHVIEDWIDNGAPAAPRSPTQSGDGAF